MKFPLFLLEDTIQAKSLMIFFLLFLVGFHFFQTLFSKTFLSQGLSSFSWEIVIVCQGFLFFWTAFSF